MKLSRQIGLTCHVLTLKLFRNGIYCIVNAKSQKSKLHVCMDAPLLLIARGSQEITLQCIHFVLLSALITTVPFLIIYYHTTFPLIPATTETFYLTVGREIFYSPQIQVRVLCYNPSCLNCFHLAISCQFFTAKILFQRWKRMIIAWR